MEQYKFCLKLPRFYKGLKIKKRSEMTSYLLWLQVRDELFFQYAYNLANAIASFNCNKVCELLSDNGEFNIKDEKGETVNADKIKFIKWLSNCFDDFLSANPDRKELRYTTDQCLHCKIGNPVIIFENGRFPLSTKEQWNREKCGLMLEFDGNLISDITFCYLFLKTDNPFIFERYCTKHPE